mgnify:CR=1 FL=1
MRRSVVATTTLMLLLTAGSAAAQRRVDERVATPATGVVEVHNVAGSVRVTGWERNEVQVTGTLAPQVERLEVTPSGDRVVVRVVTPRNVRRLEDSDLEVRVPVRKDLHVRTVSADVDVGEVRPGEVRVGSVSGEVRVRAEVRSLAEVESVSGDVTVEAGAAEVRAKSVSGDVRVRGGRRLQLGTVSGDVQAQSDALELGRFESVSGEVSYSGALAANATLDARSHSGDVTLRLPERVAADFNAQSFSGDISNAFGPAAERESRYGPGRKLQFSTGRGARVSAQTFSGDVRLLRR